MARIQLKNVWKEFGSLVAIQDLSIETGDGEFLVLLGPAGAGKTTTLKLIAGLDKPTRGRVYFDNRDVTDLPANQRNVAMTFEDYALYPLYTVYQNLANPFGAQSPHVSPGQMDAKIREVAHMLEIEPLLERRVDQLSGGQKQRVSMARSMVREPQVFLFDEPLSHVDAKIRHSMRAELHRLGSVLKTTTIYVTHDYVEALSLADRIVVIDKGIVQQIGTPHEIYQRPANEFVACMVGQPRINLVTSRVEKHEQGIYVGDVENPQIKFLAPKSAWNCLQNHVGENVRIGIRAQDIRYSLTPANGKTIQGNVEFYELWGAKGMLMVNVGSTPLRILTSTDLSVQPGQPLWLDITEAPLYIFDSAGRRLER